jgi:3,4-dihydroxy 2-butanone 4-phosphate synthase/GTP cyclohydrolase II
VPLPAERSSELARLKHGYLSSPEEIIDEARNGRMFILVDDEDRENEGDLVIPAQMATPEKINFMAKYGRGLICLALISSSPSSSVTTGISAADRARTIAVAIDATKQKADIVTPGHVFPLVARDGGVLIRAGHTEAAVDVARLAGLNPSGVICEIMNEDGTMARMDDLVTFAQFHNVKIGTIRDLIAYRRRYDHLVEKRAEARFTSEWGGDWTALTFWNKATGTEQVALVKGKIDPAKPTLVRMHALSPFADIFGESGDRGRILARSMQMIADEGAGVIVVINRPRSNTFTSAVMKKAGAEITPDMEELRDYGVGAMILTELGVHDMVLITNTHHTLVGLDGYGLSIVGERPIASLDTEKSN